MVVYVVVQERPNDQFRPDRFATVSGVYTTHAAAKQEQQRLVKEAKECRQVVRYAKRGSDSDDHYDVEIYIEEFTLGGYRTTGTQEQASLREALEAIQAVPVSANSWDPDDMGDALTYIDAVASAALNGQPLPEPMPEPAQEDEDEDEPLEVGQRVYWSDPPDGTCSGWGVITSIGADSPDEINNETIFSVLKDDGGEVECCRHELSTEE